MKQDWRRLALRSSNLVGVERQAWGHDDSQDRVGWGLSLAPASISDEPALSPASLPAQHMSLRKTRNWMHCRWS